MAARWSIRFIKRKLPLIVLMVWLFSSLAPVAHADKQELKGVSNEISRQKKELSTQQSKLEQLQKNLKQQELQISTLTKQIKSNQSEQKKSSENLTRLQQDIDELTNARQAQQAKLNQLIQSYYLTKRAKSSTNMLNNGVEEERMSFYFQHLAKQRSEIITELKKSETLLREKQKRIEAEKRNIDALISELSSKKNTLAKQKSNRSSTIGKIKKDITSDQAYLNELKRNETRLKAEIAKAAKRAAVPMTGIGGQQRKLPWPVKGRVLNNYGSTQTGQIKWKGIVIDANYGQAIKAVHPGTVVFADYLRGYGLVVLLDHGKGDMTLYGFNQSLTKKEGDKVTRGETIALAGDTGGQSRPSLYFEIRRNSQTQNPRSWLQ